MDADDMLDSVDGIDERMWSEAMTRRRARKADELPQWLRELSKRTVEFARKDGP